MLALVESSVRLTTVTAAVPEPINVAEIPPQDDTEAARDLTNELNTAMDALKTWRFALPVLLTTIPAADADLKYAS